MIDHSYLPKKYKLKEEQLDALYFCYEKDTAIMSLGTGVGKTITSCILIRQLLNDIPQSVAIFIVPSRALKAFKKELKACELDYNVWESGGKTNVKGARVLLITHTALHKYVKELLYFKKYYCIGVVDEIHNFSANYDDEVPKLNKGTEVLVKVRPIFKKFYALTATTVRNDYMSLYTMCNIVRPRFFGSPLEFKKNFCVTESSFFKVKVKWKAEPITKRKERVVRFKNDKALQKKLDDLIIFRQLSYNVDFNEIDIPLDVWDRYKEVGTGNVVIKSNAKGSTLSEFSIRLGSLQKLMDNIPLYGEDDKLIFEPLPLTNKEGMLLNLVEDLVKNHHIPLIYCFYWDTIDRVKELLETRLDLDDVFVISGQISQKERAKVEDLIKENTVTILNKAGTESINLQKADTIIFYNIPWSIQEYLQCLGRITRNDTEFDKQYVYFLEYEGTIDNYKMLRIKDKLGIVEQVQGDQLDSSEGISINNEDMTELKRLLLWTYKNSKPVSKADLLKYLKRDE